MRETRTQPSLLPYLQPEQGTFFLRLQSAGPGINDGGGTASPFTIVDDGDPLALRVQGAFLTDFGSVIKEVDLLFQRDTPCWPQDNDIPLNNSLIDHCWQQTASTRRKKVHAQPMMFSSQVGKQQELLAFAPLLFCKQRHLYFELPCPECGTHLQLCTDDVKLSSSGLPPYSSTLRRFLFCPSCQGSYYSRSREDSDPSSVHDCSQLLQALGSLTLPTGQTTALPCPECPQHAICFGEQQAVHQTLFPLSFYPFYLLIAERDAMEGFHALTLLPPQQTSSVSASPANTVAQERSTDPAIHTILGSIAAKLKQQIIAGKHEEQAAPETKAMHQTEETIVATNTIAAAKAIDEPPIADAPPDKGPEDFIEETVILSSGNPGAGAPPHSQETLQTQTVLLSPETANEQTIQLQRPPESPPVAANEDDLDLAETVLLRPGDKI